ncbi:putative quinol monooxygenase [Pseudonocardia acidicola]|uniref:Antibiotic biosynthesis monooxygenase n=1 Tax=Pseudonocardia acidicola TaxID=2724939 RepID=A0ABX1SE05_9PSEU|nr:antibiotic biosynthesis monooxygenase [Pseudonocardia acidicola]NMH99806.1 antibiotic biosynthesis monooxygenase [Pseudonocardia acidicola]
MAANPTVGLLVTMTARPGKENDIEQFLQDGKALVDEEPGTMAWFAVRLGDSTYGIFDVFADEAGRQAHLEGKVAQALMGRSAELFTAEPHIRKLDVLATKLP